MRENILSKIHVYILKFVKSEELSHVQLLNKNLQKNVMKKARERERKAIKF